YPDFNLRLAKKLKALGIPVVYYISPQVWAWRTSRVFKIKKIVDKMLVLFPFEKQFYSKYGVDVEFVGHPLLDELKPEQFDFNDIQTQRQKYGVDKQDQLIGLMPGSRWSEIHHHLPTQLATAERMYSVNPNLKFALLVAPTFSLEEIKNHLPDYKVPLLIIKDDPMKMIPLCDVILSASGTATLLVGLLEKPMVIMYKMNPLTAWLAKKFVKNTAFFGMINLVLGKLVVNEYFQEAANPEQLSNSLLELVNQPEKRRQIIAELKKAKDVLGNKGTTLRVAEALKEYL
ncbi:MAG: lipid-A-disaccharide synthase, partial [Bdellovibrionales bacterium]|nr:lipid-A-disaccharide synthase [Bdellovibrionales bacterium]